MRFLSYLVLNSFLSEVILVIFLSFKLRKSLKFNSRREGKMKTFLFRLWSNKISCLVCFGFKC